MLVSKNTYEYINDLCTELENTDLFVYSVEGDANFP